MKVLHINTSDRIGGAAIAAYRLHIAMKASGIDSKILVLNKTIDDDTIFTISIFERRIFSLVKNRVERYSNPKTDSNKGLFSFFQSGSDISKLNIIKEADIIYLHWINAGFINIQSLKKILQLNKPVFWFMHDMFPITGGCHHSFECNKYTLNCTNCPYFIDRSNIAPSNKQFNKKKKIYAMYKNLSFITPSKWLYECAKKSALTTEHSVFNIPNILDNKVFKKNNKTFSRELLNLSLSKKIILFGADNALTNPYKGFSYLVEAIQILKNNYMYNDNIQIVIFGSTYNESIKKAIPFETVFIGKLSDEYTLSALYNAADVFVIPSLAENYPNTVLESLYCHTAAVGFNIGGIPDLINRNTGYLAEYKNSKDLAQGIDYILSERLNISIYSFLQEHNNDSKIIKMHKALWIKNNKI